MIKARTTQEAQQDYLLAIAKSGSPLVLDTDPGSVVYTLSRGVAAVAVSQDLKLQQLENSSLIDASGSQLDAIAESFGVKRLTETYAQGYVLAIIGSGFNLSSYVLTGRTTLADLSSGNQYVVVTPNIQVYNNTEIRVLVKALAPGGSSNLKAGTKLFCLERPEIQFVVGNTHTTTYLGDITGGRDTESDTTYRQRVGQYLASTNTGSKEELTLKLTEYPLVTRAFVRTVVGGYVEIWVDSLQLLSPSQLKELKDYISPSVAAGVVPILGQVNQRPLDFTLVVEPFRGLSTNLAALTENINVLVNGVLNSLSVGEALYTESLVNAVKPFVRSVAVTGVTAVTQAGVGELLVPGDIKVTYPVIG
jgi:uncharacterized phage protein gp47/JayE